MIWRQPPLCTLFRKYWYFWRLSELHEHNYTPADFHWFLSIFIMYMWVCGELNHSWLDLHWSILPSLPIFTIITAFLDTRWQKSVEYLQSDAMWLLSSDLMYISELVHYDIISSDFKAVTENSQDSQRVIYEDFLLSVTFSLQSQRALQEKKWTVSRVRFLTPPLVILLIH